MEGITGKLSTIEYLGGSTHTARVIDCQCGKKAKYVEACVYESEEEVRDGEKYLNCKFRFLCGSCYRKKWER